MAKKKILPIILTILLVSVICGLFFLNRTVEIGKEPVSGATSTVFNIENEIQNSTVSVGENEGLDKGTTSENFIASQETVAEIQRYIEENQSVRAEPLKRADDVRALYMNESVANSPGSQLFKNIEEILKETEINAVVIDIKESEGPYLPQSLKKTIERLHEEGAWVIARICAFKDASLVSKNPSLYIKKMTISVAPDGSTSTSYTIWKDSSGGSWLDPASPTVQNYIIDFAKTASDFGFDELQFDYIRFPSDGDLKSAVYPVYDGKIAKYEVMKNFFLNLSGALRRYNPSIILSVDIFGYVAGQHQAVEIGQRIQDVSDLFDYVSFMLYPSHFYNGFIVSADPARGLPALNFPYNSASPTQVVANHPYDVILRSVLSASDFLKGIDSATKIRPWLQDFDLKHDTRLGIYYNAQRVRAEIMAAEDAGSYGWMLWSASNVYTSSALQKE